MINNTCCRKVIYFIGSLLVFLLYTNFSFVYADEKSDIAELEAFYHQVFDTSSKPKQPVISNNSSSTFPLEKEKTKKHSRKEPVKPKINQQGISKKDPELVAFYEMVFGDSTNLVSEQKVNKPKPIDNRVIKIPKIKTVNVKNKSENKLAKLNTTSQVKDVDSFPTVDKTIQSQSVTTPALEKRKSVKPKTQAYIEDKTDSKPKTKNTSVAEAKRLLDGKQSDSKPKNIDTAALFEKAFGKKKDKKGNSASKVTKKAKDINSNDMASLFAKAFGSKTAMVVPSNVKVDVRVNGNTIGEIDLISNSSGELDQIKTKEIVELLKNVLKEHVLKRINEEIISNEIISLNILNKQGVSSVYNSTNLSLDLEINPELRKPLILSLKTKKKASVREENKVKAEDISGYLNTFANVGLNSGGDEADLRMRFEGSLNINGFVLETTSDYRNKKFDMGRTTLIYDKPEKLKRFAIGNISTGNRNFQENLELDGIRISKEFFLDPNLQISPRANESLQLETDSEVELYINNQLIRRFYLNAGVYALEDIGLYNGANNIRIRIKDEFGKVTVKRSEQYYDSHLLKPGLSLYAFSVGYLSNQQSYSNSSLEKKPIFSGYYQKGVSKNLTLSLDAQLSSENYLLGAETISSIPIGSLRSSVAISGGKEKDSGYAASFEFKPNKKHEQISLDTLRQDLLGLDTRSRGLINSWSITGEFKSKNFSALNGVNPDLIGTSTIIDGIEFGNRVFNNNKFKGNLQTNFNLNISEKWQGNLNLGVADYYDADESYYSNLSATRRFDNGTRLSIGARYDTEEEYSMNFQISIPLSKKKGQKRVDLDVLADSRDNAYETKLSLKPTSLVGKNSLAGSLEHFQNKNSKQQLLDVQYRNNLFESKLTARNRTTNGTGRSSQQLNLGLNTSLACVGGSCATSYPINDSFALVSGPSNQTQPIALSNNGLRFRYSDGNDTGLPDNYSALIPGKNKKAVVRLESYRTQNINVDEGTLPNGYDSEKTEFSVFPKYHQGFLLKAGGEPATTLDGMLFDDLNNVLSFKGGQWIPMNKGKAVAFFSNKGGKFRVSSIPAGKYKLELFDYPDMNPIQIDVPQTNGKIHDIGNLIIKTPN